MIQLQLQQSQFSDFQEICKSHPEQLNSIAQQLRNISPVPLQPAVLFDHVTSALIDFDGQKSLAEALTRQCLSLNGLMRQTGVSLDELMQGLRAAIRDGVKADNIIATRWGDIESAFKDLIAVRVFRIVAKAIDLTFDYANLFRKGRILTDVRPLFTDELDGIEGSVIAFTLRLRYESLSKEHELSIAMDESDVRQLEEQCKRAIRKAHTCKNAMNEKASIPTVISGEQSND